ncbi:MAG: amidase [Bryobacterales bacterium]|nr:amidase [Bryobacterales bacterium]
MDSLPRIAEAIAARQTTPSELVEQALAAIDAREGEVRAWTYIDAAGAREQAAALTRELESDGPRGPLHGVPCGVKDIFDVAGMPCEWGASVLQGRRPDQDAALVAELRRAGAVILGKTVTTAFAYFDPGPTRNPHNPAHTPGGSSSGSAAAVASGMVPLAVGSQTMGSVLRPASFCGVCGFKPSFNALPLDGVMQFARSLDHAGLFALTTEGMRLAWGALRPVAEERPLRRVAALAWPATDELELEMAIGYTQSLERLRAGGVEVIEYDAPAAFGMLWNVIPSLMARQAANIHGELLDRHGKDLGEKLALLLEGGRKIDAAQYLSYIGVLDMARKAFEALVAEHAMLVTPSAMGPAPEGLASTGDPRCNALWTALGVPAIGFPFTARGAGLPLGLQLVAGAGQEARLLATANRFEQILHGPKPVIVSD